MKTYHTEGWRFILFEHSSLFILGNPANPQMYREETEKYFHHHSITVFLLMFSLNLYLEYIHTTVEYKYLLTQN